MVPLPSVSKTRNTFLLNWSASPLVKNLLYMVTNFALEMWPVGWSLTKALCHSITPSSVKPVSLARGAASSLLSPTCLLLPRLPILKLVFYTLKRCMFDH